MAGVRPRLEAPFPQRSGGWRSVRVVLLMHTLVCFTLDETRYAVPAERVLEIVARVMLTPLPAVPSPIVGVFSYRGVPMAAVDLRARLGHPTRSPARDDHFLVVRSARRDVALVVDRVNTTEPLADRVVCPPPLPARHLVGVVALDDGLLLIEDLDAALSLDEERAIDAGLRDLGAPS
ncbi:MAG: chemotaxis protein CheW [Byssovorax sp.]